MTGSSTKGKGPLLFSRYYQPFWRQSEFHESRAKYRLFGGAAGPGKTKALLWEAILQANEVAGCDTLLLRRTYPELESSLLAYFRRDGFDYAIRLLPQRERRLPVSRRGVSVYRDR